MGIEVNNCCFCIELKTGSLIIGYLSLVGTVILTILSLLGTIAISAVLGNNHQSDPEQQEKINAVGTIALIVLIIILVFQILNLIFVIILLVGLHKDKSGNVKAYLIYNAIYIVLSIIMFIVSISSGGSPAGNIIRDLITIVLSIYFLIVIRSYYLKMDDPSKRPAIYNTA